MRTSVDAVTPATISLRKHALKCGLRARLKTLSKSVPLMPLSSALRTLCSTSGQRLHRGLLRQHFFFGFMPEKSRACIKRQEIRQTTYERVTGFEPV